MSIGIIRKLDEIGFTGEFPGRIDVLLVPFQIAYQEMLLDYPELTESQLKAVLKKYNILLFNNVDEWSKYKGIKENAHKQPRS